MKKTPQKLNDSYSASSGRNENCRAAKATNFKQRLFGEDLSSSFSLRRVFFAIGRTRRVAALVFMPLMLLLASCGGAGEKPNFEYMPNMTNSPAVKAYEEAPRMPVEGTVPRGFSPYHYTQQDSEKAGVELKNPLPRTAEVFAKGKARFETYCLVCHGPKGMGDGPVTEKGMPRFSLMSDNARSFPDGHIYNIISDGRGLMPSYATQILREDRWAIIHYVRALQRAAKPTAQDIEYVKNKLKEGKI